MNQLACLVIAFACLALPACGDGATDADEKIVVGFAQTGAESSWRTAETRSIREEAAKRGIDLRFADGQGKQENQTKALRTFIAQGVDVILLAPLVATGWEPVLREVKRAGIPVILVSRGVEVRDPSLYETLIASDFVAEGRAAAEWLAKETDGECNIIELHGTPGSDCATERREGFAEVIAKHPNMKIKASQSGDFRRTGGKEVMEALLKVHGKDIHAVYAHNDDMAIGAIQAIEVAGLKPGEDIKIVSVDGVKAAFDAMVNGTLNCSIECPPLHGPAAFDAVEAVLAGTELPKRTTIPLTVFDRTNAKDFIDTREY